MKTAAEANAPAAGNDHCASRATEPALEYGFRESWPMGARSAFLRSQTSSRATVLGWKRTFPAKQVFQVLARSSDSFFRQNSVASRLKS